MSYEYEAGSMVMYQLTFCTRTSTGRRFVDSWTTIGGHRRDDTSAGVSRRMIWIANKHIGS
eukprot:scaffold349096_cov50-Prasinocladus_malaysianus.AAC.1